MFLFLQLVEIQDVCCEFLKRQLDPSNCLGIRAFADTHACRDLLRIADKFTHHNFQEVQRVSEWALNHNVTYLLQKITSIFQVDRELDCLHIIGNHLFNVQTIREIKIENKKKGFLSFYSVCMFVCLFVCLSVIALQTSSFNIGV